MEVPRYWSSPTLWELFFLSVISSSDFLGKNIPANSHACGLKTSISHWLTPAGQFLAPNWKMRVVAILLDTISKNMLTLTHVRNENWVYEKWIKDNTFLAISDFWSEKHWEWARIYMRPKTSEDFGLLQESSEMIVSSSKIPSLPG